MITAYRWQTTAPLAQGMLSLPVISPFFQLADTREVGNTGRNINLIPVSMNVNIIVDNLIVTGGGSIFMAISVFDTSDVFQTSTAVSLAMSNIRTNGINATIVTAINSYASGAGYTISNLFWASGGLSAAAKSFSNPSRSINTAYQVSSDTLVTASLEIDASLSLTTGAKGTATLEYADDSGFTTNVKTAGISVNGNTGTLVVGLNTVGAGGGVVSGLIPASKYYRVRTTNVTGTPSYGSLSVQEVTL